jgi:leucyl-tRNA synthetase
METYGADATRFALADAGDALEDANFVPTTANAAILRLHTQLEFISTEVLGELERLRTGEFTFADRVFESKMNQLIKLSDQAFSKYDICPFTRLCIFLC